MSEESKSETGDGWREVVHIVNNIRKGHPYLDALEILCSAVEESDKWSERKRVLEAKADLPPRLQTVMKRIAELELALSAETSGLLERAELAEHDRDEWEKKAIDAALRQSAKEGA